MPSLWVRSQLFYRSNNTVLQTQALRYVSNLNYLVYQDRKAGCVNEGRYVLDNCCIFRFKVIEYNEHRTWSIKTILITISNRVFHFFDISMTRAMFLKQLMTLFFFASNNVMVKLYTGKIDLLTNIRSHNSKNKIPLRCKKIYV